MTKRHSKKYIEALSRVDENKAYDLNEASQLLKDIDFSNFDTTVEVSLRLNVDTTQADQQLRGALVLPNGSGKTQRVVVFASGDKAKEAKEAGADFVGADDLVEKIQGGWFDFDVAIATPDMMARVGRIGRVLGPKGLMPNPKEGTVTMDVAKAVSDSKGGKITYRTDKNGNIAAGVGKISFDAQKIAENIKALSSTIISNRPASVKGTFVESAFVTSTFGPSVKLDLTKLS